MPRKTKEQRLRDIHQEALRRFDEIQSAVRDEREQCLADRRFYSIAGAQWEGSLGQQFENKPKFEVNKIHLSIIRIFNEYRNNRISVDFIDRDGSTSKLASVCDGLYRADEKDSGSEEAFDNAFEEAVGGGFGALRLRAEYEDEYDEDNDNQRIRIEPIYDADSSVFFDLNAKRQDKADAEYCFVLHSSTPEAFEEEWGVEPSTFDKAIHQNEFDWVTPDVVYTAEYYLTEDASEKVYTFEEIDGSEIKYSQADFDGDDELEQKLEATGATLASVRRVKRRKIHKYILSGNGVLEDCGYVAGKCIPVIPAYGKRWFVDNIERCMGHVRLAKDAQRLKNMQLSKLGEISALSSVEKPILLPEQIAGHQMQWAEDNIKDYPYLLLNPITDGSGNQVNPGPMAYTRSPQIPPAMAALLQITESDINDILGNQGEADKMVSNISGKAIEMIQARMDMQTFIYVSNFAKAVRRVGEVWLSMAKEVYVEPGRKMKTVGKMGEVGTEELTRATVNKETGAIEYDNDLSSAHFDVTVSVGPSFTSRREATVRALTNMIGISNDPESQQVLQGMAVMNMDGEGIEEVREHFRKKLVMAGVLEPTEEDKRRFAAAQQNQQPDPNEIFLQAAAEEAIAKATKARADVVETLADAELKKAKTAQTLSDVQTQNVENAMKVSEAVREEIDTVAARPFNGVS